MASFKLAALLHGLASPARCRSPASRPSTLVSRPRRRRRPPTSWCRRARKNINVDADSAFMDNSGNLNTELDATLQMHGIDTIYIAGIATEVCVKRTVRDALKSSTGKYKVHLITDASAGLTTEGRNQAVVDMRAMTGVTTITSADILAMKCPEGAVQAASSKLSGGVADVYVGLVVADIATTPTTTLSQIVGPAMASSKLHL
ncbi:unnamed protein product [Polarella glacialis]|uniref:nicotinamidase n=1 Tax=Polarella glacialis TaxID=89957 RepID=A0A813J5J7_POLGL|nr:unnamed protein product [Polarella glacialis]